MSGLQCSFVYSFNDYVLNSYYAPGTYRGYSSEQKEPSKSLPSWEWLSRLGRQISKYVVNQVALSDRRTNTAEKAYAVLDQVVKKASVRR